MDNKQKEALAFVQNGNNVFLTGPAGTGKSYTIRKVLGWLRGNGVDVSVTAMTGAAAILIGGKTLHSALGIGMGTKSVEQLVYETKKYKKWLLRRLLKLEFLIVDEVSMLTAELLEKINDYLMEIRKNSQPFGGVRVMFVGDFYQLGPVDGEYCFLSPIWKKLKLKMVQLDHIYRQEEDSLFQSILARARVGEVTEEDIQILLETNAKAWKDGEDAIEPTKLFAKNACVDSLNSRNYKQIVENGAETCSYKTTYSREEAKSWAGGIGIKEAVPLCVGAQVMITWNISMEDRIINGTRGIVVAVPPGGPQLRLRDGRLYTVTPQVIMSEEDPTLSVVTMPVRMAFALSIHKSQGCTLDAAELDLGPSIFTEGQAYTALSRARSLESLKITQVTRESFRAHPDVVRFYQGH